MIHRRRFLATAFGACVVDATAFVSAQVGSTTSGALTREQRDRMTPAEVIDALKKGNERFRTGTMRPHDYRDQQRTSAAGQFPAAVTLGCVDSRAPSEIIFDAGIGDMFARVKPAISATDFAGDKSSKNPTYVDAVARTNVLLGLEAIRRRSPILAELEQKRSIALVGGMYDVATGSVELLS